MQAILLNFAEYAVFLLLPTVPKCTHVEILIRWRVETLIMGKLNVALLRYLSKDHFRVLTAVRKFTHTSKALCPDQSPAPSLLKPILDRVCFIYWPFLGGDGDEEP